MKIGLYMYNTSPLFEIIIAKYILETKYEVVILSDEEEINTAENIKIRAKKIDERNLEEELGAIIVCGGELEQSKKSAAIKKLIQNMNDKGKIIASICSGNNIVVEAL
ncbi:MAG: DJ-1/PfpI family protein, partial [Roseburia sp.]|nr:DJ-1/PfpI family protein [Roseburia sp.]